MSNIRLPNSEYLPPEVLDLIYNDSDDEEEDEDNSDGENGENTDDAYQELESQPDQEEEKTPIEKATDLVYQSDPAGKALTARTPERIFYETGIRPEEMFPKDAKILYVGDPWQRMGRELDESHGVNLTIIDYEYGEIAVFQKDDELFRERIQLKANQLLSYLAFYIYEYNGPDRYRNLTVEEIDWLKTFQEMVSRAHEFSQHAKTDEDYAQAAYSWQVAKEFIENSHESDSKNPQSDPGDTQSSEEYSILSELRKEAWYCCSDGVRGFRDIPDWNNLIKPKLDLLETELADLPPTERERRIAQETRSLIEEIRLEKRPEHVNVVEAVFPQLPFKDEAFDRFVASWSISAHVFAELDQEGFAVFWDEIHRVLADGGEAYIFPLHYFYEVDEVILASLNEMVKRFPDTSYQFLDNEGHDVRGYYHEGNTLVIYKDKRFENETAAE